MTITDATLTRDQNEETFVKSWKEWHVNREETLASPYGWLALTGLHWVDADTPTTIPGTSGYWQHAGSEVIYHPPLIEPFPTTTAAGGRRKPVTEPLVMRPYEAGDPTRLYFGDLQVELILRDGRYALRTRDPQAASRKQFQGVDHFPVTSQWRLPARFERLTVPQSVNVNAIVAGISHQKTIIGTLHFVYQGEEHQIEVFETNGVSPSILFRDPTNGESTYGAGRFIYLYSNELDDVEYLDFNRAINPPCFFSQYCTCPVASTRLPFPVMAGEKATVLTTKEVLS